MRLCIPTDNDGGLEAPIAAHFGSAPYLTLVDSETGVVEVVPNGQADHAPGTCETAKDLPAHAVDAVVCRGLGRRAFACLQQLGIGVFVTEASDAGGATEAFRSNHLGALTADEACRGGRHHGAHHRGRP